MINANELRLGNMIIVAHESNSPFYRIDEIGTKHVIAGRFGPFSYSLLLPIQLTEAWLVKLGFEKAKNDFSINGFSLWKQCDIKYKGVHPNRDATWLEAGGTFRYPKTGEMAVAVLCKGNYVCNNLMYVHEVQNAFFALTGEELTTKE